MSFLTINNYPIPIKNEEAEKTYEKGQSKQRAYNGNLRSTTRFKKKVWELQTTLLTADEADILQSFLEGEGHYFPFDSDFYSTKGLSPEAGFDVTQFSSGGKFDSGYIKINGSGSIQYDFSYSYLDYTEYTVIAYADFSEADRYFFGPLGLSSKIESSVVNWNQYAITSNGDNYFDGSLDTENDADFTWIDMTNELLTLQDTSAWNWSIDEIIVLPFVATDEMISSFYNLNEPFSSLPRLKMNGDISNNRQLIAECEVESQPHQQFRNSEGWQNNGQRISFTIQEV